MFKKQILSLSLILVMLTPALGLAQEQTAPAAAPEQSQVVDQQAAAPADAPQSVEPAAESALVQVVDSQPVATAPVDEVHAVAAEEHSAGGHHDVNFSLIWIIPFVGMLLSIALGPIVAHHFWEKNQGKIAVFWALAFLIPCIIVYGLNTGLFFVTEAVVLDYMPFILLLLALFTVSGGIRLKGSLVGTPVVNAGILLIGTILASWMGTTGAAMLLIRPLLKANRHRKYRVHQVVFFIFLVANIGGSLSPLGDPPLFLGFLRGVDFFWTTSHLLAKTALMAGLLLVIFFIVDSILFKKEGSPAAPESEDAKEKLGIEGGINFIFLLCVVANTLLSGSQWTTKSFNLFGVDVELKNLVRDGIYVLIALASWFLTDRGARQRNEFSWGPILEVAKLFIGIFISMVPAIAILRAGTDGALGGLVSLVSSPDGTPNNAVYFWLTGALSSFLDNAPTYLVFFNMAGGDPQYLMNVIPNTLAAISAGAVFMGANTYIGNAPNFMVRSIATSQGVKMPSFFGYMAWSVGILCPLFLLLTFIFFI